MGKLDPRCFAANSDTVYFLARGVRETDRSKNPQEFVVLVKSDPYPESIKTARWTVVSTSVSSTFGVWYDRNDSNDLVCSVNDDGVFTFTGPYNHMERQTYLYDPQARKDPSRQTTTEGTLGEWIQLRTVRATANTGIMWSTGSAPEPFALVNIKNNNTGNSTNQTDATSQAMFWYKFYEAYRAPTIVYSTFDSLGQINRSQSIVISDKLNGTVQSIRYGDEKLWVILGTNMQAETTLVTIPFSPPYNLTSPATLLSITPITSWHLSCNEWPVQTSAVFGGKLYFTCRSNSMRHLYIYDSATNKTEGPFSTKNDYKHHRSLTLVPGKPGILSPAYGLLCTASSVSVLDLKPGDTFGQFDTFESGSKGNFKVEVVDLQPPKQEEPECLETCTEMRALATIIGSCVGAGVVLLICCCFTIRHCQQKRRRRAEAAVAAVQQGTEDTKVVK
ncbi:hypothetical protein BGZ94_001368 [Podila epigama]|nr:hypothetical protein BGZ94_001368 [Podila epigama]